MKTTHLIAIALFSLAAAASAQSDQQPAAAVQPAANGSRAGLPQQASAVRQPGHLLDHGPRAQTTPWVNEQIRLHAEQNRRQQAVVDTDAKQANAR